MKLSRWKSIALGAGVGIMGVIGARELLERLTARPGALEATWSLAALITLWGIAEVALRRGVRLPGKGTSRIVRFGWQARVSLASAGIYLAILSLIAWRDRLSASFRIGHFEILEGNGDSLSIVSIEFANARSHTTTLTGAKIAFYWIPGISCNDAPVHFLDFVVDDSAIVSLEDLGTLQVRVRESAPAGMLTATRRGVVKVYGTLDDDCEDAAGSIRFDVRELLVANQDARLRVALPRKLRVVESDSSYRARQRLLEAGRIPGEGLLSAQDTALSWVRPYISKEIVRDTVSLLGSWGMTPFSSARGFASVVLVTADGDSSNAFFTFSDSGWALASSVVPFPGSPDADTDELALSWSRYMLSLANDGRTAGALLRESLSLRSFTRTAVLDALARDVRFQQLRDSTGRSALHLATSAAYGQVALRVLLKRWHTLDARDSHGRTALFESVRGGVVQSTALLLRAGADVNVADTSGVTPLHVAAASASRELIELLLARGANVGARDNNGRSVLHVLLESPYSGVEESLDILLIAGADASSADNAGRTPLHLTAAAGRQRLMWRLCLEGGDPDATDELGRTPEQVAVESAGRPAGDSVAARALQALVLQLKLCARKPPS